MAKFGDPDASQKWCIDYCKSGYTYEWPLGMQKDGVQCARNCCKLFAKAEIKWED